MKVQDSRGIHIELGEMIKSGGEAQIRLVKGQPALVAKIYHAHRAEREAKLKAMLAKVPVQPATHTALAWPTQLLYEKGRLVGFLMPKIERYDPIISFYNPTLRKKQHPGFHWRYLHRTASNLAIVVETVHQAGHVVGDLNESNILVNDRALVTLVDTDSFQIQDQNDNIYRCLVGKAEYTSPELQSLNLSSVNRRREHDYFGLGVLIFQLLMQGYHPFSGVLPADLSVGRVDLYGIKEGLFPYHQNGTSSRIQTPPNAPPFALLHPDLQALFIRCFVDGHQNPTERPTAREWLAMLHQAEQAVVICAHDATHIYSNHLASCPFCPKQQAMQMPLPSAARMPAESGSPTNALNQSSKPKIGLWEQMLIFVMVAISMIMLLSFGATFFTAADETANQAPPEVTEVVNTPYSAPSEQASSSDAPYPAPAVVTTAPYPEPAITTTASDALGIKQQAYFGRGQIKEMAYSPDGKLLVVATSRGISLIDVQTFEETYFINSSSWLSSMALSPDGQILASGPWNGTVRLWSVDGTPLATLEGHTSTVSSVAFSADNQTMASASWDNTVRLWKNDGTLITTLEGHTSKVKRVTFSPDGQSLASASDDRTVRLWDATGRLITTLEGHTAYVNDVAFSPDGKTLATASHDKTVRLWSTDGTLVSTLSQHTDWVNRVAFSPDGQIIASASNDQTIRLWDSSGTPVSTFSDSSDWVDSIAFSPDGQTLAFGSADGYVYLRKVER